MNFNHFANIALSQDSVLRQAAAEVSTLILESEDTDQALKDLFAEFRGPYVVAKQSNAKEQMTKLSRAWNAGKSAVSYHLRKGGFTAEYPNLRSGEGNARLVANQQATDERKEKAAAAQESERREAQAFQTQQAQEQLDSIRALSVDQLADQIEELVSSSSSNMGAVLAELVNRQQAASKVIEVLETERLAA